MVPKSSFANLPIDLHLCLSDYLSSAELINLSQTSQQLRQLYAPISWRKCIVLIEMRYGKKTSFFNLNSELTNIRPISTPVFCNPERYSWFLNKKVVHFFTSNVYKASEVNSFWRDRGLEYKTLYPSVRKLVILEPVTNVSYMEYDEPPEIPQEDDVFVEYQDIMELTEETGFTMDSLDFNCRILEWDIINIDFHEIDLSRLVELKIFDKKEYSSYQDQDFGKATYPNVKKVIIDILDPLKVNNVLNYLKPIPRCAILEIMLYYHTSSPDFSGKARFFTTLKYLNNVPISLPEVCLILSEVRPVTQSYQTMDELELTDKITLEYVVGLDGYSQEVHVLFDYASFPKLRDFFHPYFLDPVESPEFLNISTLKLAGMDYYDLLTYSHQIKNFPNLMHFSVDLELSLLGSPEDAAIILKHDSFRQLFQSNDCDEAFRDSLEEFPKNAYQGLKEIAAGILKEIQVVGNSDLRTQSYIDPYVYGYFLEHLFSLTSLKTLKIDCGCPHPLWLFRKLIEEHKSLECLYLTYNSDNTLNIEGLNEEFLTGIPHMSSDYESQLVYEIYPVLYQHQKSLSST